MSLRTRTQHTGAVGSLSWRRRQYIKAALDSSAAGGGGGGGGSHGAAPVGGRGRHAGGGRAGGGAGRGGGARGRGPEEGKPAWKKAGAAAGAAYSGKAKKEYLQWKRTQVGLSCFASCRHEAGWI